MCRSPQEGSPRMSWSQWFDLTPNEVANEAPTTCGVYCIARKSDPVSYAPGTSLTVFLGVGPDRQRGLRAVLAEIAGGARGDLQVEKKEHGGLRFCYLANLGDPAAGLYPALPADF